MPLKPDHEFSPEEISLVESNGLTIAEVRDILSRFSTNAEGSAELELDTAISAALEVKAGKALPLESFIQNEVSEEVARNGQEAPAPEASAPEAPSEAPLEPTA